MDYLSTILDLLKFLLLKNTSTTKQSFRTNEKILTDNKLMYNISIFQFPRIKLTVHINQIQVVSGHGMRSVKLAHVILFWFFHFLKSWISNDDFMPFLFLIKQIYIQSMKMPCFFFSQCVSLGLVVLVYFYITKQILQDIISNPFTIFISHLQALNSQFSKTWYWSQCLSPPIYSYKQIRLRLSKVDGFLHAFWFPHHPRPFRLVV